MKIFNITENDSNQRLDKFLKKLFPNASSSLIYKFNRKNKIKVNNKKEDNEYKLQIKDEVKIYLNDSEIELLSKVEKINNNLEKTKFDRKNIVYEDSDLIIINKDAGINVHPGDHKTKESNIISQVQDYLGNKLNSLTFKPSLVHRIDRDTSGILIIAKKKDILTKLTSDFKEHKNIKKFYYAIVLGKLPKNNGTIDKKILRIENAKDENKVIISEDGQKAITHYKVLNEFEVKSSSKNLIFSELEVEIETGRMHQIRVHLSSIGNPILGDNKYGDKALNSFLSKNYLLKRQALHSWKIQFHHYGKQKNSRFEAKIKDDLINFLKKIKSKI
ncbi:RluA family pseudouridine synthase [Candidatus Gracilibacteria bacterium]|nr:RluA family pseudouridine synthase [Candidatus Gracilibacteria bacterium]